MYLTVPFCPSSSALRDRHLHRVHFHSKCGVPWRKKIAPPFSPAGGGRYVRVCNVFRHAGPTVILWPKTPKDVVVIVLAVGILSAHWQRSLEKTQKKTKPFALAQIYIAATSVSSISSAQEAQPRSSSAQYTIAGESLRFCVVAMSLPSPGAKSVKPPPPSQRRRF